METIYELRSENLTQLGGPMGSERVTINFRKYFSGNSPKARAKAAAQANYPFGTIKWYKTENGCRSGDLGFVMYYITKLKVE